MGKQQTSKKVKVVGTQQYLNVNTGEIEDFQVTGVEERDFNFHKVWMKNFISTLDLVGNKKSKLCFWIIDNLDKENKLTYTQAQIVNKTGLSKDTVTKTMSVLMDSGFLQRINGGCYIVNPDIVFKGTRAGRLNALTVYTDASKSQEEETTEEMIKQIEGLAKTIDNMTKRMDTLKQKLEEKGVKFITDSQEAV